MTDKKQYSSMKDMKGELESMIRKMRERSLNGQPKELTRGADSDPQSNSNISKVKDANYDPFLSP